MIPREKIEEVRRRADILEVIGGYVHLTKRGQNYIGLCPFHSEKTPSFSVSTEKSMFYCFGCNTGGNAVSFLIKKEGLSFPEAVKSLARKYGIIIDEAASKAVDAKELLYRVNSLALEYYAKGLSGPEGKAALAYLGKRGFGPENKANWGAVKKFNVGFAPKAWDGLLRYFKSKGVKEAVALASGLVLKGEKGLYDRFRQRLMFPITDGSGRISGFGGRAIDDSNPKYLNSPESPVFRKGEILFGLHHAKKAIVEGKAAIVVEGYFDLISMHAHGFENTVATMGTALSIGHIRTLKGYGGLIYALFDSDEAGQRAALRGVNMFIDEEAPCRVVLLKGGKDPDELLRKKGADALRQAIAEAVPIMDFYLTELKKRFDLKTPEGKKGYLEGAIGYLARTKNVAEKGHYADIIAADLRIKADSVYDAMNMKDGQAAAKGHSKAVPMPQGARLKELAIIKIALRHPEFMGKDVESAIRSFSDPLLKKVGGYVLGHMGRAVGGADPAKGAAFNPGDLIDEIDDDEARGFVAGIMVESDDGFIEAPERMLKDCVRGVLDRGRPRQTTIEMIKSLEDAGRLTVAEDIRKRLAAKGKAS